MWRIKLVSLFLDGLNKLLKLHEELLDFVETIREWELMNAQTKTFKEMKWINAEIDKLKEENVALQDKYDYIQHLKEVYCHNR